MPVRITHVINSLGVGGAEILLYRLLRTLPSHEFQSQVISLIGTGEFTAKIEELGVPVHNIGMSSALPNPRKFGRVARAVRAFRPDVVHTWMYHANLIGGAAAKLTRRGSILWSLHASDLDRSALKPATFAVIKACQYVSRIIPSSIVATAQSAAQLHARLGYPEEKIVWIANGSDIDQFKRDTEAREQVRRELSISPDAFVIGQFGRFNPQKDHENFVRAAGLLGERAPHARFLLCGLGVDWENTELVSWIDRHAARERFHLLGSRNDMPRLAASLDVASLSSSWGETTPLVISESMACEVPAVVTDIGDSAHLVGETGRVVPPKDPQALADAWHALAQLPAEELRALGRAARARVAENFNLTKMTARYAQLYTELAGAGKRPRRPDGVA
ncbi:MAG TPA: glycosyltransferase [Thermoanaerobaculia bacterium]|nr:glycosyltransferase [Thermoanaerobaculia bacterium]